MFKNIIARLMRFGGEAAPVVELPLRSAAQKMNEEVAEEHSLAVERRKQQEARMAALHNAKPIEEAEETIEIPKELEETQESTEKHEDLPMAA